MVRLGKLGRLGKGNAVAPDPQVKQVPAEEPDTFGGGLGPTLTDRLMVLNSFPYTKPLASAIRNLYTAAVPAELVLEHSRSLLETVSEGAALVGTWATLHEKQTQSQQENVAHTILPPPAREILPFTRELKEAEELVKSYHPSKSCSCQLTLRRKKGPSAADKFQVVQAPITARVQGLRALFEQAKLKSQPPPPPPPQDSLDWDDPLAPPPAPTQVADGPGDADAGAHPSQSTWDKDDSFLYQRLLQM